jgi:hypothetical protein
MADLIGKLDIYRKGEVLATIDIDRNTVYNGKLQSTKSITCQTLSRLKLPIEKEDYIIWDDEVYTLDKVPDLGKDGSILSQDYKMVFQATRYHLLDWFVERDDKLKIFPYVATAKEHCLMIIASANDKDMNWAVGEVDDTEPFLIEYDWHYALPAIEEVATKAKLEFEFIGKTLRMVKSIGRDTGLVFKVGQGQGLHKIQRSSDTSKSAVNRVYGIGGTKNIDSSYRTGLEKNLVFDGEYVETPELTEYLNGTGPYVRLKEVKYTNEERYPHFSGVVAQTAVQTSTDGKVISATITDPNINFDVNLYFLPGIKATVSFLSGSLTGKEFELTYNHSTKTVTLVPDTDTNGYTTPNDVLYPEVGDKFTFLKIKLPAEYYATEELKLKQESQQYLLDNQYDSLLYGIEPDPHHLRVNQIKIKEGDRSTVQDEEMDLDEVLRIVDVSYPLVDRYSVTALIGNEIIYDKETKPYADAIKVRQQLQLIDRRGAEIAKRNSQNLKVLADSIFDVDGNFDATKFNVGVLSALLGIFGLQSSDFLLNKVFITANFGGDVNAVNISAGELIHLEYTHGGTDNVWQMQPITQAGLVAGNKYYVYSKISTTSNAGTFIITTDQLRPNDNPGFYTLRTGIIYPVNGGYRDADFTYGITTINGRQIKAGIIEGNTGALSLNLDTGDIFGKLTFRASNGTIKDVATVDNKAALADANALAAQITADNAKGQAEGALKELADIADDGILDASEKVSELKNWRLIESELPLVQQQANGYGVSITDYNAKFTALGNYVTPLFANMNNNSPIDRTEFINKFKDYYNARQAVYNAIANATKELIGSISVGGRNTFKTTTPLSPEGFNLTPRHVIKGVGYDGLPLNNGIYAVGPADNSRANLRIYNVITENGSWTVSGYYKSNGAGSNFYPYVDICDLNPTVIPYDTPNVYQYFEFTIDVNNWSDNIYNFVDFSNIGYVYVQIQDLKIEKGNKATGWSAAPEDIQNQISQLNDDIVNKAAAAEQAAKNYAVSQDAQLKVITDAYADGKVSAEEQSRINQAASNLATARSEIETARLAAVDYANSQIAIANANVLSSAAATAQTKADASRNAAITSSQEYARAQDAYLKTLTDSYADGKVSTEEQARISQAASILQAAKDDATTKANTAAGYGQAAQTAYNQLTAALKPLAYQDVVQLSQLQNTVISNGMLVNTLIDTNFVRSNIINVGYIESLSLRSTQGTIGGWNITSTNLYGSNGGTTIELNVTNNDPFFQVVSANGSFTRINYQGVRTTYTVTDDVKVLRAMFINADHVFFKSGVDSNGDDQYSGRVGDYGSNGYAFIERNAGNILINTYDITANHFMTGSTVRYFTLTNLSDMRYKKSVKKVPYGLKEILQLDPISFKYKLPKKDQVQDENKTHFGLSAQAVKNIMPELVIDGERLSVATTEMIPVLIKAIQELQLQINTLTN